MNYLSKYRKSSIIAAVAFTIAWLLSLAAIWNSLLRNGVKQEGWLIVFMIIALIAAIALFYFAYSASDEEEMEKIRKEAYESGKSEILQEAVKKNQDAEAEKAVSENVQQVVESILSGIQNVRSESGLCNKLLAALGKEIGIVQGIMYVKNKKESVFNPAGEYALTDRKPQPFTEGEALAGQTALNKSTTILYDIPENYFVISSGLGNSQPRYLLLAPVVYNDESIAVLELASFKKPDETTGKILEKVLSEISHKLNKYIAA